MNIKLILYTLVFAFGSIAMYAQSQSKLVSIADDNKIMYLPYTEKGDMTFSSSEPHQRWAVGCLYDNIESWL